MPTCKDWLSERFTQWEREQGRKQSYYAFARFLGVSQTDLAQWMEGASTPAGDDLRILAELLGPEIYDTLALPRPNPQIERLVSGFPGLPAGLRERLSTAIWESNQYLKTHNLMPETVEAKKAVFEIFSRCGIKLTN